MPRQSRTQITKELAEKIAAKLQAVITNGSAHDLAAVFHDGTVIATFGIRRGSRKTAGHDHIPRDLHVGPGFAKALGRCPKSRQDWLNAMRDQGLIDL